jgi:protein CpxP
MYQGSIKKKGIHRVFLIVLGASLCLTQFGCGHGGLRRSDARRERIAQRVEARAINELGLTADQESRWKEIGRQQRTALQAIRNDRATSAEERKEKAAETMKQFADQRRAMLSPDQQKKFDELQQKLRERMQERRGTHDGTAPDRS